MKKTVTTLLVVATVFLCIPFNVFALTSGGKTIVSSAYSYNNGDVTLYARVNGHKDDEQYTGGDRIYTYQHAFIITLANNTNNFQVASTNSFTVDLYTGYTDTFAQTTTTPSGNQTYRPSWGSEVTSYSDNMTAPQILMYPSGDNAGHVLITFKDSDLLVLNPNETREYTFTINFNMSYDGINQYPIGGNPEYSYFTLNGSVSMYSRPSGFTSNTIENFINNDSLPNSVIAYFQYLLEQGTEEQATLDNIYSYMIQHYPYQASTLTNQSLRYRVVNNNYDLNDSNNTSRGRIYSSVSIFNPYIDSSDHNIFTYNGTNVNYEEQSVICVPIMYHFRVRNFTNNSYLLSSTYFDFSGIPSFDIDSGYYASSTYDIINESGDLNLLGISNSTLTIGFTNFYNGSAILYADDYMYIDIMEYRYYVVDRVYDTTNIVNIRHSITNYSFPASPYFTGITVTNNNAGWSGNIKNVLNSIKDKLQQLLDTGIANQTTDNLEDQADDNTQTEDTIHAQEQQWYQDNETAINAVGLSNYQFTGDQTSGLTGVTSQFTSLWNALDGWTNVYIFVLTLSLATFILRHKPETKMTQEKLAQYRPYSVGHLVRRSRSYH